MSVTIPIIAADGTKSTVTLPVPPVVITIGGAATTVGMSISFWASGTLS